MSKRFISCLWIGIMIFQIFACQTDLMSPQKMEIKNKSELEEIVQQSRGWYESQPWSNADHQNLRSEGGRSPVFLGKPKWQEPSFFKLSKTTTEFIRFPLLDYQVDVSYTSTMAKGGFRDLLMRKADNGEFIVDIIEMHPDADYLVKKKAEKGLNTDDYRLLVDNTDYTGYFLVYSKDNTLRYGERRENGVPVSRLSW